MRRRSTALIGVVGLGTGLGVVAQVQADSQLTVASRIFYFRSEDAGIGNRLTVDTDARGRAHFLDEADPFGMNYPPGDCSPGKINNTGNVVEVFCDKRRFDSVTIQSGPGEDAVTYALDDRPGTLEGGVGADVLIAAAGADQLFGGQGNDQLDGRAGNDVLDGGEGADIVQGGEGDDDVRTADGVLDRVDCGPGTDAARADDLDEIQNCETVSRIAVAAPAGAPAAADTTRPALQIGGSTRQAVSSSRRRVTLALTVSEPARVDVSGFLAAGGINDRLRPRTATVKVAGGGTTVRLTLTTRQLRRVLADLRRRRRPKLTLTVSAVDAAGNTSRSRHLTIALRRG